MTNKIVFDIINTDDTHGKQLFLDLGWKKCGSLQEKNMKNILFQGKEREDIVPVNSFTFTHNMRHL